MLGFTKVEDSIFNKEYFSIPRLTNSLGLIRGVLENIWSEASRIVNDYADHGQEHNQKFTCFEKLLLLNPYVNFFSKGD